MLFKNLKTTSNPAAFYSGKQKKLKEIGIDNKCITDKKLGLAVSVSPIFTFPFSQTLRSERRINDERKRTKDGSRK